MNSQEITTTLIKDTFTPLAGMRFFFFLRQALTLNVDIFRNPKHSTQSRSRKEGRPPMATIGEKSSEPTAMLLLKLLS